MLSAEELHRRGVIAMNAGRLPLATSLLRRALDRAGDSGTRALIEASLAYVEIDTSDFTSALAALDRALDFPDLPSDVLGVLRGQRAVILHRSGRTPESLAEFARAIDALRDRPLDLAIAYVNRGNAHLFRDNRAAVADFAAAVTAARQADEPGWAAKAQHNEGYARYLEGDLVGALSLMESAAETLANAGPLTVAIQSEDRAEVLLVAGLRHEGAALHREAARIYGRLRMRQRQGESEVTLASHLRAHDPAAARKLAMQARRRFTTLGSEEWQARADAAALAAEVDLGGHDRSLLDRAAVLVDQLTAQGLDWGAASIRLHAARVLVRRGDPAGARRRLAEVRLDATAPLTIRLLARDARSELEAAQGRRKAALMHLRQGLEELHAWQSSFGSLDLQTMVIGNGIRLAKQALVLAVESGRPDVVFEWSERARMLASRVQPVKATLDDEAAADLAELRGRQSAEDGPRIPQQRRDADDELRRRIRERAWRLQGSGEVTTPCSLAELQAGLGETALIAWVVTADRVTGLIVTSTAADVVDLGPRAPLDELLQGLLPDLDVAASAELPDVLARSIRTQLSFRLADLSDLLVAPLQQLIGDRPVVLTPSGVLAGVPWTLLERFGGRPVTVARSATTWLASTPLSLTSAGFVAGPRVARGEEEVKAAASVWQSPSVLVGLDASTAAVSTLAGEVDVLHVAAHGRHSGDNPLFSGLEFVDGVWFGYDIDALERVPQVVLLSACEVGRSSVRYGEELIGMTAAWLHAGARCVIASPAAVSDEVAHDVFVAVHSGLAAGLSPAEALAAAVPAVSAEAPPAPFTCFA